MRGSARWITAGVVALCLASALLSASLWLPLERATIFLKYLQVLIWPSTAIVMVLLLRTYLPDLIGRISAAELPMGIRIELDAARQAIDDATSALSPTPQAFSAGDSAWGTGARAGAAWGGTKSGANAAPAYGTPIRPHTPAPAPPSRLKPAPAAPPTAEPEEEGMHDEEPTPWTPPPSQPSQPAAPPPVPLFTTPIPPRLDDLPREVRSGGVSAWALTVAYDRLYGYLRDIAQQRSYLQSAPTTASGYAKLLGKTTGHSAWFDLHHGLSALERVRKLSAADRLSNEERAEYLAVVRDSIQLATRLNNA